MSPLVLCTCDFRVLSTQPGKHVVFHWDPSEHRLCGGTVPYMDRVIEAMSRHYGYPEGPDGAPVIDYFWSTTGAEDGLCRTSGDCVMPTPSGKNRWSVSVFSSSAIQVHELAHAAIQFRHRGTPSFLGEGLATQWGDEVLAGPHLEPRALQLSETAVRDRIDQFVIKSEDYDAAHAWWRALEVAYGPAKMGELAASVDALSSSDEVDGALQAVLGVSLAESVEIARNQTPVYFDIVDCHVQGLSEFVLSKEALRIDRGGVECGDSDMVNWHSRVAWPFILHVPEWTAVEIEVEGGDASQGLNLTQCLGEPWVNPPHLVVASSSRTVMLDGLYSGYILGDLEADGTVRMPTVTIRAQP